VGFLAILAQTGLIPEAALRLVRVLQEPDIEKALAVVQDLEKTEERKDYLTRLLAERAGLEGTPRLRLALGRIYLEEGSWQTALETFLRVRREDASLFLGEDLLQVAKTLYDRGRTGSSKRLLDMIQDAYPGTETAWKALVQEKQIPLERRALARLVYSLENLQSGPLRLRSESADLVKRLLDRVGSIQLKRFERMGDQCILGDFLPDPGLEQACLQGMSLTVRGAETTVTARLPEMPDRIHPLAKEGGEQERVLFVYSARKLAVFDPMFSRIDGEKELAVPFTEPFLVHTGRDGTSFLLLPLHGRGGLYLATQDLPAEPRKRSAASFPVDGSGISTLFTADLFPGPEGKEIGILAQTEEGSRLLLLRSIDGDLSWEAALDQDIPGKATHAVVPGKEGPVLLCLSTWSIPEGVTVTSIVPAGLYRLERPKELNVSALGENQPPSFELKPWMIIEPDASRGTALFLDAEEGDFDGDGRWDAVFLVRFTGSEYFDPETRLLFLSEEADPVWLHCPGALGLNQGDLEGDGISELILDFEDHWLSVTF
jgi:hypothetical protein